MTVERVFRCALVLLCLYLGSRTARADVAAAEAIFREGRRLIEEGKTAEACDKFAESHRLEASSGALFNLAACHADLGRTASAWAEFLAAARLARGRQQMERANEAEQRASQIEPLLVRLTVRVVAPVEGLAVTRNGEPISPSVYGTPIPVDPGTYSIRAVAPGRSAFDVRVELSEPGTTRVVDIPELASLSQPVPPSAQAGSSAEARPPSPALPSRDAPKRSLSPAFWISGAAGVGALAVGSVAGVLSLNSYETAESLCASHRNCSSAAIDASERAGRQANIANVGFGVAVVALVASVWLYVSQESAPRQAHRIGLHATR